MIKNEYTLKEEYSKISGVIKVIIQIDKKDENESEFLLNDDIEFITNVLTARTKSSYKNRNPDSVNYDLKSQREYHNTSEIFKDVEYNQINVRKNLFLYGNKLYQM